MISMKPTIEGIVTMAKKKPGRAISPAAHSASLSVRLLFKIKNP